MLKQGRVKCAILGSGNIGTDLVIKIKRLSALLDVVVLVGIDVNSDGLKRASRMGIATTAKGIDGFVEMPEFESVSIVFDATSASAHSKHDEVLRAHGKIIIDLTPAAIGPFVIPSVNLDEHLGTPNVNMVTCGGQATIPIIAAVNRVSPVFYAEIIASIASKSAGPGTRANIDEFTETTSQAIMDVGGAEHGKAIIILNPAEPPLLMRDTVYCLCDEMDEDVIRDSIQKMVEEIHEFVPGYRMKQAVQFQSFSHNNPLYLPDQDKNFVGLKVSVFLEVEGAAHYLPAYAGNLDIMTSAAVQTAERIVMLSQNEVLA